MKKAFVITFFIFLLLQNTKAQNRKMISFQLSYNQVELGFEHKILTEKLRAQLYAGIANEDINSNFDDFTSRLGLGFTVLSNPATQISIHAGCGLYFTNNHCYSVTVPLVYAGIRCARRFGKTGKHQWLVNAGCRFGYKDFSEKYSSDIVKVSTIGTLKLTPLYFSVGYGFNF